MELQKARDWLDLELKSLLLLALVLFGVWAGYRFWIARTSAPMVQLTVSTEYQAFSGDSRLLLIHVKPKNIGKVNVQPGKDGLVVMVRSIAPNAGPGVLDLEKMREVHKANLTDRFPDDYPLVPGVEYDEVLALVVPKGVTYAIKATLDLGDDAEVSHTVVARTE
jgi:hypothetical protein